jgi:dethiobiotin synthetase
LAGRPRKTSSSRPRAASSTTRLGPPSALSRGGFVTGTDTGVGKTVLTAAIVAALRGRGVDAIALKPIITGLAEPADPVWPPDHELLARVSGVAPAEITAVRYAPPVSPHLAAELSGRAVDLDAVRALVADAAGRHEAVVVEGVGGLLVPLGAGSDVRSLAASLGQPLIVAARPGLGTINHALLTLEAARRAELEVAGVVLTPWPRAPQRVHRSNRSTIERLGDVEVCILPEVSAPEPELLRAAAAELPLERWLGSDRERS